MDGSAGVDLWFVGKAYFSHGRFRRIMLVLEDGRRIVIHADTGMRYPIEKKCRDNLYHCGGASYRYHLHPYVFDDLFTWLQEE